MQTAMVKRMEYLQLSLDEYTQSKEEIKKELGGIVKSFVQIGWHLTRIDNRELIDRWVPDHCGICQSRIWPQRHDYKPLHECI